MKKFLDIINNYATLINSLMTFLTIIVGIITVVQTGKIANRNMKQYEEDQLAQKEKFEKQLKRTGEIERIQEQPYLVFKEARISEKSDSRVKRIDINFVNKGRGAAYDIIPVLECKANTMDGESMLRRADAIQDPIAMVGENFDTLWTLGYDTELVDFMVSIPINYTDASGRKYKQIFDIIFHKEGYGNITNFANPELCYIEKEEFL